MSKTQKQEFTITMYTHDAFTDTDVWAAMGGLSPQEYFGCDSTMASILLHAMKSCHPGTGQGRPIRRYQLWGPMAPYAPDVEKVMITLVGEYWVREKARVKERKAAGKAWNKEQAAKE